MRPLALLECSLMAKLVDMGQNCAKKPVQSSVVLLYRVKTTPVFPFAFPSWAEPGRDPARS